MEAEGTTVPRVEAVRALVQAFEDGSSEGVAKAVEGAKRKGTVHFLASVFANISMVSHGLIGSRSITRKPIITDTSRPRANAIRITGPLNSAPPPPSLPGLPNTHRA
jgi:hypothetical protein